MAEEMTTQTTPENSSQGEVSTGGSEPAAPQEAPSTSLAAGAQPESPAASPAPSLAAGAQAEEAQPQSAETAPEGETQPPAEKKPEEEKPQGAPEQYTDFKLPDGYQVDSGLIDGFKSAAKELDLSQEKAQAFVDKMTPVLNTRLQALAQQQAQVWAQQTMDDPEIGGTHWKETAPAIARVRDTFAKDANGQPDPQIMEALASPMGNHPGFIKLLARIGNAISESGYPQGKADPGRPYTATDWYRDIATKKK